MIWNYQKLPRQLHFCLSPFAIPLSWGHFYPPQRICPGGLTWTTFPWLLIDNPAEVVLGLRRRGRESICVLRSPYQDLTSADPLPCALLTKEVITFIQALFIEQVATHRCSSVSLSWEWNFIAKCPRSHMPFVWKPEEVGEKNKKIRKLLLKRRELFAKRGNSGLGSYCLKFLHLKETGGGGWGPLVIELGDISLYYKVVNSGGRTADKAQLYTMVWFGVLPAVLF